MEESENQQGDRLTIKPQTFFLFERNQAEYHKDTTKNPVVGSKNMIEIY